MFFFSLLVFSLLSVKEKATGASKRLEKRLGSRVLFLSKVKKKVRVRFLGLVLSVKKRSVQKSTYELTREIANN